MFDDVIRLSFLSLVGASLVLITTAYLGFLVQQFSSGGEIVIEPFTIVSQQGKEDDLRGKAFAQALQARLQSLVTELRTSEDELKAKPAPTRSQEEDSGGAVYRSPLGATGAKVPASERLDSLKTGLLEPMDLKLSVAGVEVSGMLPWLQRLLVTRRTAQFAVFTQNDGASQKSVAKVFGSVGAFGLNKQGLQLEIAAGQGESEPSAARVADQLAHEIVRRYLAQVTTAELDLLTADDFTQLSDILAAAAQAKRRATFVSDSHAAFVSIAPKIFQLADQTPSWTELTYFAAWIADNAGDTTHALTYYKRAESQFQRNQSSEPADQIAKRITALTPSSALPTSPVSASSVDLSRGVLIRDGGSEGSVVGQALATALEVQIAKATGQSVRMSPRFIYYAARKAERTVSTDSGAQIRDGIKVLQSEGTVEDSVWPYVAGEFAKPPPEQVANARRFKIADATPVKSLNDIKQALQGVGPVVIGITVYTSFESQDTSRTGIVKLPARDETVVGGHAIVIVGYNDETKYLKFANSWGASWGDHGFGYLPYDYISNPNLAADGWTFKFAEGSSKQ